MTPSPSSTRSKRCGVATLLMTLMAVMLSFFTIFLLRDSFQWFQAHPDEAIQPRRQLRFRGLYTDAQAFQNAQAIKQWRNDFETMCQDSSSTEQELLHKLDSVTRLSRLVHATHEDSLAIQPCRHVFIDLGANVGDSMQKFISAGIPKCYEKLPNFHPSFNATTGSASTSFPGGNQLVSWSWNRMNDYSSLELLPEDYCYFGVEGNPAFSDHLHTLERSVMRMDPRPLRRVHFFTQTVTAGEDGPTKLHLDTVNTLQTSWGSSLLASHKDAQASGGQVQVDVQGMALTTLFQKVVDTSRPAHVMVKMDIEGGEFAVLEQAAWDGTICDWLVACNMKLDVITEQHKQHITGPRTPEPEDAFQKAKDKLVKCGMNIWTV